MVGGEEAFVVPGRVAARELDSPEVLRELGGAVVVVVVVARHGESS